MIRILSLIIGFCFLSVSAQNKVDKFQNTCGKHLSAYKWLDQSSSLSPNQEKIDISYYRIDLQIDIESEQINGNVLTKGFIGINQPDSIELDFSSVMIVDSVYWGGELSVFEHVNNKLKIPCSGVIITEGYEFNVQVFYHGSPISSGFGSFNFDSYNGIPHIWTLSEPYGARDWWPCKDDPSDKADSVDIIVSLPEDQILVSNGLLINEVALSDGQKKYHWSERYPISTYLVAITSYPYTIWHDQYIGLDGDTLPLDFYVYPDHYDLVYSNYLETKNMMEVFAQKFGEYPFMNEKYGHVEFQRGGGMEHQTITSMGGYSQWLIAHELGHQWWGNLVTCANFQHIWLNEGFARFSEAIWEESSNGIQAYKGYWSNHAYYGPGTVFVEDPSSTSNIFNGNLTYNKAGWVVHMLRGVLGDSIFFESLQSYASNDSLAYDAVTTENFKLVCESKSGLDLEAFFQQWIYGEYYPKYSLDWTTTDANDLTIYIQQEQIWQNFKMPIDLKIFMDTDTVSLKVENQGAYQEYTFNDLNGVVQRVELDPDNWILKEVQYLNISEQLPSYSQLLMYPAYPNPFNPKINVNYFIPEVMGETQSSIYIYDLNGKRIDTIKPQKSYPGLNKISWNAINQASGTYFIQINANNKLYTQKIQLIK